MKSEHMGLFILCDCDQYECCKICDLTSTLISVELLKYFKSYYNKILEKYLILFKFKPPVD
jgi:hypothetical protein